MPTNPSRSRAGEGSDQAEGGTPAGVQVLAFVCGLVVAYLGFKSLYQDWRSLRTLTGFARLREADGRFLKVGVRADSSGARDDYYPDVLYEYFVGGKSIWGWRLSYEESPKPKAYWEGRLAGYRAGAPVKVYYDPERPKESILEKKREGLARPVLKLGLGSLFFAAGMVLAILPLGSVAARGRRRPARPGPGGVKK